MSKKKAKEIVPIFAEETESSKMANVSRGLYYISYYSVIFSRIIF